MVYKDYKFNWTTGYFPFSIGLENCEPGHAFGPGVRSFHIMHYVLSGAGVFRLKGKEYHPKAGDLFIFAPQETVYYKASEDDPWTYLWINFAVFDKPYAFESGVFHVPFLQPIFKELINYPDMQNTGYSYVSNCLEEISIQLSALKTKSSELAIRTEHYIQDHYTNADLTIVEIANILGVNRCNLTASFSSVKHMSPLEYLIRFRLEKACEYMLKEKLSPSVAAYSVGYKNYSNFAKMFKKYYGVSPREYQQKFLK